MSIGTKIIKRALGRIGAHSVAQPAAPESIVEGMDSLNDMLREWESQSIRIEVAPLKAPGDELGEPPDCTRAIIDNLAIAVATSFDNGEDIVSPRLEKNAKSGFNYVKLKYQKYTIPKKKPSSTLPMGEGNSLGFYEQTFSGSDGELDG